MVAGWSRAFATVLITASLVAACGDHEDDGSPSVTDHAPDSVWTLVIHPDDGRLDAVSVFRLLFDTTTHCVLFEEPDGQRVLPVFHEAYEVVDGALRKPNGVTMRSGDIVRTEGGFSSPVDPLATPCGVDSSWEVASLTPCPAATRDVCPDDNAAAPD